MNFSALAWWCGLVLVTIPLLLQALRYWNDALFLAFLRLLPSSSSGKEGRGKLLPGHMGLPFIGETFTLLWYCKVLRRPDDFIKAKKQRYGEGVGMYRTHLFGSPTILTCSPASNKFVLKSSEDFRIHWPVPEVVGFSSVFSIEGKQHASLKSFAVNAINQPRALRRIADSMQPRVVSALRSWAEKGTINAVIETKKVILENICKVFVSMDPSPLTDAMDHWFQGLAKGLRTYPINFPGSAAHHAVKCRRKLTAVFGEELEKRKARDQQEINENGDLMDGLMQFKDEERKHLTDDEVVDNIVNLVAAGYDSTSVALVWALYQLYKSPEVLQKLREENKKISEGKKGEFITMDNISQMNYTAKVVEETIRLANATPFSFRFTNRDIEYEGYRIPKDWQVVVWFRSLHTDPMNFDDPLSFNPDRWNQPAKPGTFQAFGGGHRICAGNMLARIELTIILHHLALGYKWELLNPNAKMDYLPRPRPADGAAMAFSVL